MKDIKEIIAQNLCNLRKSKHLTQFDVAEKFNYSDKAVSKWERAETMPDIEILFNLASFYGVTLDYLTEKNHETQKPKETKEKQRSINKLNITLLSTCFVWLVACILFVTFKFASNVWLWQVFMWSVPITCIVLLVFNAVWGKRNWRFITLTVLNWSTFVCIYLQIWDFSRWAIFLICVPIQLAIIFWGKIKRLPIWEKMKEHKKDVE